MGEGMMEQKRGQNQCALCGRFFAWGNLRGIDFMPDSDFTSECVTLACDKCAKKDAEESKRIREICERIGI